MSTECKWVLVVVGSAVIGFIGFVLFLLWQFRHGDPIYARTTLPLSRTQAEKQCPIPLSTNARNIQYAAYGRWQGHTALVRFEAPAEECLKHIDAVLAWHDKAHPRIKELSKRTSSYSGVAVTNVSPVDMGHFKSMSWFNPDIISRGVHAGQNASHTPQIWVDLDRGVFYFRETD